MLHQGKIPAACFRAISQKDRCNFTNDFSNRFSVGKNIEIPTSSVLTCIRDRARSVRIVGQHGTTLFIIAPIFHFFHFTLHFFPFDILFIASGGLLNMMNNNLFLCFTKTQVERTPSLFLTKHTHDGLVTMAFIQNCFNSGMLLAKH